MRKLSMLLAVAVLFTTALSAGEFNWRRCEGQTVKVLLVQHTYTEGLLRKFSEFEKLTGIKINHAIIPEDNYGDKLATQLASKAGDPDVFMAGPYHTWEYAPGGYMYDIDELYADKAITDPNYDMDDFFPGILGTMRWDLVPGHKVGTGKLWGVPIGFEVECIAYNKDVFAEKGVTPPTTAEELYDLAAKLTRFEGEGSYGITVRGTRNWATVNTSYLTLFANYGAVDMAIEDGRLVSKLNSPESIKMTDNYVKMVREGCSPSLASYNWYQCQADFGARKAAMLFDASILGFFTNAAGASNQSGKLAATPAVLPAGSTRPLASNLWAWGLCINKFTKSKDASWLFLQYFTGKDFLLDSVINFKSVDTPRQSVFKNPQFQARLNEMDGYINMFEKTIDGATILFTPNPYHFEITTMWAATLQDLVAGMYPSTEAAMNQLKTEIDKLLANIDLDDY